TPTAAATTTESAMRDMTSLLPIFCSAQLMKTLAQNVEMRRCFPRSTEKVCHQKNGIRRCPGGYPVDFRPVLLFRYAISATADNGPNRQRNGLYFDIKNETRRGCTSELTPRLHILAGRHRSAISYTQFAVTI